MTRILLPSCQAKNSIIPNGPWFCHSRHQLLPLNLGRPGPLLPADERNPHATVQVGQDFVPMMAKAAGMIGFAV